VLGGFDPSRYVTERLWATAPDNTRVPISLVYRQDLARLDGSDPMLLDAYGSYEAPNDPDFRRGFRGAGSQQGLAGRPWSCAVLVCAAGC
jgi:protease II